MKPIRILIADDHTLFREGIRMLIAERDGIEVVGEAATGTQTITLVKELNPDIVIMDVSMPEMNGIEATRRVLETNPETRVLALSVHTEMRFIEGMLQAGASGYLLKSSTFEEVREAIGVLLSGQTYLSPQISQALVTHYVTGKTDNAAAGPSLLSSREQEVLTLLAEGKPTRGIAERLAVSVKTIETHRAHIMQKLGLHSVAELTKYAIQLGLVSLDS